MSREKAFRSAARRAGKMKRWWIALYKRHPPATPKIINVEASMYAEMEAWCLRMAAHAAYKERTR